MQGGMIAEIGQHSLGSYDSHHIPHRDVYDRFY
jgi:hypothetical protein